MSIRAEYLRDLPENVSISYTSTGEQKADVLTKGLAKGLHQKAIRDIGMRDSAVGVGIGMIERKESQELCEEDESNSAISALAFATDIGQLERVQRSSQIQHPTYANLAYSLDIDQLERVQRSSQIDDPSRLWAQSSDPFSSTIVPICSVEDSFVRTVLSDKLSLRSSSGRTFGRTVLSDELSLKSSLAGASGQTVLSDKLSSFGVISESLRGHSLEQALEQQHADIIEDSHHTMAITIISAQNSPVRCDRTLDTDLASDSSDSWF